MSVRRVLVVLPLAAGAAGCVYWNGLYNGERAFGSAEKARLAGRDSAAVADYAEAQRKAERSVQRQADGAWSQRSLYLLGRARLRRGDFAGARDALERARAIDTDPAIRAGATLYLGAVAVATGDHARAEPLLDEALAAVPPGTLRGEGHLWRARLFLSMGLVDQGWWDLDRAAEQDPRLRVTADLERLTWGVMNVDSARALEGARGLLADPAGARRADSLAAVLRVEEGLQGSAAAARLLRDVEKSAWTPVERDGALLLRARIHLRAADTAAAIADASAISAAPGSRADEVAARLFLARIGLARADRVAALDDVRALLLPIGSDSSGQRLLEGIGQVTLLLERAQEGEGLGWFAAGEVARDVLGAPMLATALFVRYADGSPAPLWRGKALLAALDACPDPRRKEELRRRAAALAGDPYVTVAMGGVGDPAAFEQLERELRQQLGGLVAQVTAQVRTRDPIARRPEDSVPRVVR